MKRALVLTASLSILSFLAGKHLKQQQTKALETATQHQSLTRNFHRESTVTAPFRHILYPHFKILYSTYHRSPLAVHQLLSKELQEGDAPRSKFFFPEQSIKEKHLQVDQSFFYETQAYRRFNVNRGHMAAAGNYSGNQGEKFHTFSFANVIPQNGYNNGGIWNTFQRYSRKLVTGTQCQSVEVISGPIYLKETPTPAQEGQGKNHYEKLIVLKENGIHIPQRLFKIIKCNSHEGKPYLSAFTFLNSETYDNSRTLQQFKTPITQVERVTGLNFDLKGEQLDKIDAVGLKLTKKELDHEFYFKLMINSESVGQMQDNYRRAREQKIEIDFKLLSEKIRSMALKQIAELQKGSMLQCDKLGKILRIKKKLYQLYHKQQTRDIWERPSVQIYERCIIKTEETEIVSLKRLKDQLGEDILKLLK